ncbi:MAG: SRPBCC family protein [Mycobacterium sp.]|uniref:SRPBCC family protein n=1 Tax=Mycobacterium sp. TaxID=1785 RepID=UPI001EC4B817|nr:SRPBCC family protein [Mycobacterium sp.]MBV8786489.1 SRPBCC family protein [Mycobacterium sp.]
MGHSIIVAESRVVAVGVEDAFGRTLPAPLPVVFSRRRGVFPPVKDVRDQTGGWDAPGQTRTVLLAGGASMREELTSVDPPRSFGYRLTTITGPLALLVDHVVGKWFFAPVAGGTEITWRWDIHPRSALAARLLPLFARLWKGYARQVLADLEAMLTA